MPSSNRHTVRISALLCLLFASASLTACSGPSKIDEECIKGRLSKQQAAEINQGPWGHLPTYNRDADGKCKDCAQAEDRVLSAKCSDFIKRF